MAPAHVEIAGIRRDGKRLFGEAKVTLVHGMSGSGDVRHYSGKSRAHNARKQHIRLALRSLAGLTIFKHSAWRNNRECVKCRRKGRGDAKSKSYGKEDYCVC